MCAKQVEILEIRLDQGDLDKKAAKAAGLLKALKEEQKELRKANMEGTVEYQKLSQEIARVNQINREVNKTIQQNVIATKAAKGSNEQLRAQLALQTRAYNKLSQEQRENTENGQRLQKSIKSISDELKKNESAVGDNRRNVGNYKESVMEAIDAQTGWISSLKNVTSVAGAIALVVGSARGAYALYNRELEKTARGEEILARRQAVTKSFWDQVANAIAGPQTYIGSTLRAYDLLQETVAGDSGLVKAYEELIVAERELQLQEAKRATIEKESMKLQEDQRQIRDDTSRSIEERIAANAELGRLQEEQLNKELEIAQENLRIADLYLKTEGDNYTNQIRRQEALFKIADIEERINGQQSEQLTNLNSLRDEQKALADEKQKAFNEEQDRIQSEIEKRQAAQITAYVEYQDMLFDAQLTANEREVQAVADKYDRLFQLLQESNMEKEQLRAEEARLIKLQEEETTQVIAEQAKRRADELKKQQEAIFKNVEDHSQQQYIIFNNAVATLRDLTGNYNDHVDKALKDTQLLLQQLQMALQSAQQIQQAQAVGGFAGALGVGAGGLGAVGAGLGVFQVVRSFFKKGGVAKAARGRVVAHADGTKRYDIGGRMHSEGGTTFYNEMGEPQFEAERGETAVIMKREASAILKRMSDLNESTGGVSFMKKGGYIMRDGGVVSNMASARANSDQSISQQITEAISRMRIFATIEEINRVGNRVKIVENRANG